MIFLLEEAGKIEFVFDADRPGDLPDGVVGSEQHFGGAAHPRVDHGAVRTGAAEGAEKPVEVIQRDEPFARLRLEIPFPFRVQFDSGLQRLDEIAMGRTWKTPGLRRFPEQPEQLLKTDDGAFGAALGGGERDQFLHSVQERLRRRRRVDRKSGRAGKQSPLKHAFDARPLKTAPEVMPRLLRIVPVFEITPRTGQEGHRPGQVELMLPVDP
ncbi:hypothetical protein SDC9_179700 [bioreactor metagenome]|uniref:Uncharacterized protein n=1 Tax=bioreactor metagenome TaxID=1076179 RepID=A0A645H7H5_9ZZZZ